MSPLLGPILAQLVTLGVSDRTEGRYVVAEDKDTGTSKFAEVASSPRANLNFGWRHATLSLGYGPTITVTPLEAKDPSVLVFHSGVVAASERWARTTVTLSESVGYGQINFRVQALADPRTAPVTSPNPNGTMTGGTTTPPANGGPSSGQTGTGTANQPQPGANAQGQTPVSGALRLGSSVTALGVSELLSSVLTVSGALTYAVSGVVGGEQPRTPDNPDPYPTTKGPGALVSASYSPTHYDAVTTSASTQLAVSSNGNHAWVLLGNETWSHKLDKQTATSLGEGLSLTRNSEPIGLVYYSVYPHFSAGINHTSLLGRSTLTVGSNVASAPYIDPVHALVDPSLSASAFVGLNRDRFSSSLTASSAVALATHGENKALNATNGAFTVGYRLGAAFSVDSGVRAAWQTFGGNTTVPPSLAAFVGFTMGAQVPLNGG